MSTIWSDAIPEALRERAREAVHAGFGSIGVTFFQPIAGGGSGALTYKMEIGGRLYFLRLEGRRSPLRNPHQYVCMGIAADAGIAPPLRYADDAAGVAILDFVSAKPLAEYPGGPAGLAAAVGTLAARLQATASFPGLGDYRVILERMLNYLRTVFAPGLLDPHAEGFERIRQAYPWDASAHVSSHNDPNPGNILFDGQRLWLIDWETAYRNDALADIAILTQNHAASPDLEDVLLESWLGRAPDRTLKARLRVMRQWTRLYYAGILLAASVPPSSVVTDLTAATPDEFRNLISSGQLQPGTRETKLHLGKMYLAGFLDGLQTPDFMEALAILGSTG